MSLENPGNDHEQQAADWLRDIPGRVRSAHGRGESEVVVADIHIYTVYGLCGSTPDSGDSVAAELVRTWLTERGFRATDAHRSYGEGEVGPNAETHDLLVLIWDPGCPPVITPPPSPPGPRYEEPGA